MDQDLLHRLSSFVKWPMHGTTASPVLLANAGFVYSGHGLWVTCPHCCMMMEGKRTNAEFNARYKHRMESPQCPLALECSKSDTGSQYASVNTIPADHSSSNDRTIGIATSEATHDIAINTAASQSRDVPGVLYSATAHHASGGCAHESNVSDSIDRQNPDFNRLRAEAIRLGTFYDWPTTANVQAAELAADGWFFTGRSDRVRCAFCRGVLHNWAENDEPASEHRRHFPNCFFVKGRNVGNVPLAKTKTASASEPQPRGEQWSTTPRSCGGLNDASSCRTLDSNVLLRRSGYETITQDAAESVTSRTSQTKQQFSSPRTLDDERTKKKQHLLDENCQMMEARICKICMDKEVEILFLPCGHFVTCNDCARRMRDCPFCRSSIKNSVKMYQS